MTRAEFFTKARKKRCSWAREVDPLSYNIFNTFANERFAHTRQILRYKGTRNDQS